MKRVVNQMIVDVLQTQGIELRSLPDRSISEYSWEELTSLHPDVQPIAAKLLGIRFIYTLEELQSEFVVDFTQKKDEPDYDFEKRIGDYAAFNYLPLREDGFLSTDKVSLSYLCFNPFLPQLDDKAGYPLIMSSKEVVRSMFTGNGRNDNALINYREGESVDSWINRLIGIATDACVADIEVTSHPSSMKVRFKSHGAWGNWVGHLPMSQRGAMLRALCASASPSLDYESGTDHDFKLERRIQGIDTSWRGAITPAALGDSVTLRILPGMGRIPTLPELGYCEQACRILRSTKKSKGGLVLVTGATGHGKTTTLYSLVTEMRDENLKVFTVENPVEMVIPGTVQKPVMDNVSIDEKFQITFPSAIRSAMRHAPDVLVVGESRDTETAKTSVNASRTGHLTFSTLHTSSAEISIKRMVDLGVDALNLADTLLLVVSQDLVSVLCDDCKIQTPSGQFEKNINGCVQCNSLGVRGRTVVYEMLLLDEEARNAIIAGGITNEYARLKTKGDYIAKFDIANRLWLAGSIDLHTRKLFDVH